MESVFAGFLVVLVVVGLVKTLSRSSEPECRDECGGR